MAAVPSSKNRRRVEITVGHYDGLKKIADAEGRTMTSLLDELLGNGLRSYQPVWAPSGEPHRLSDNLTDGARRVLEMARVEMPRLLNHNYSGTEHILLALVHEGHGLGGKVARRFGLEPNKVLGAVEFIIGRGKSPTKTPTAYTPRVYKVMALSLDEARRLGHNVVGTGHLLLGLIREGEGIAAGIWESLGASAKEMRDAVLEGLASGDVALSDEDDRSRSPDDASLAAAAGAFQDRVLTCAACGKEFVFTAGEQAFYAGKGFSGRPGRCPECRAKLAINTPGDTPRDTFKLRPLDPPAQ